MNSGIYALYWWAQDLIYIGQSIDINRRFKEHITKLVAGIHTNYKVQEAYYLYGSPSLEILELCHIEELNQKEIEWTIEFDSIKSISGLNIIEAGRVGYGTSSNASKYSKLTILKVFRAVSTPNHKPYSILANIFNVNSSLLSDIKNGKSHTWLKKYKFRYSLMTTINTNSNSKSAKNSVFYSTKIQSPDGKIFEVSNIRDFANRYSLANTHLGEVLRGSRKSHKGWKLPQPVLG